MLWFTYITLESCRLVDHVVRLELLWCLEEAVAIGISTKVQTSSVMLERVRSKLFLSDEDRLALHAFECCLVSVLVDIHLVTIATDGVRKNPNAKPTLVTLLGLNRQYQLLVVRLMLLVDMSLKKLEPAEFQAAVLADKHLEMAC